MLDLSPIQGGRGLSPTSPNLSAAEAPMEGASDPYVQIYKSLGLSKTESPDLHERTDKAILIINNLYTNNGELVADIDFTNPIWLERARVERALHAQIRLADRMEKTGSAVNFDNLLDLDLDRIKSNILAFKSKGFFRQIFDETLAEAQLVLAKVVSVSGDEDKLLEQVEVLKELQDLLVETSSNRRMWSKLLGACPKPSEKKDPRFWLRSAQFALPLLEFCALTNGHPDQKRLVQLLKNPKPVYDATH